MLLDMQHWKPSPVFSDRYLVSDKGEVMNRQTRKLLKPTISWNGYYRYALYSGAEKHTLMAHKLVALAFIPNPGGKPCVDHINIIRTDNRAENLRWVTHRENARNPLTYRKTSERGRSMIKKIRGDVSKETAIYKNGALIKVFKSETLAAKYVGCSCKTVSACISGRQKQSKGYTFKQIKNYESEVMI